MWRVWIEIKGVSVAMVSYTRSPSVWRVWIEITMAGYSYIDRRRSPSVWRVWIEITPTLNINGLGASPSVWRVWIEIFRLLYPKTLSKGHPPCGGCGLK